MEIQPKETRYNGYVFRSRLESRWAIYLDALGIKYSYEPETFELAPGVFYLPDFWLSDIKYWVEVKPTSFHVDQRPRLLAQSLGHQTQVFQGYGVLVGIGAPGERPMLRYSWEIDYPNGCNGEPCLHFTEGQAYIMPGSIEYEMPDPTTGIYDDYPDLRKWCAEYVGQYHAAVTASRRRWS